VSGSPAGAPLDGLSALITGGASGIGLATARLLAGRGASVAVLDRQGRDAEGGVLALEADVTAEDAVKAAVERAARELGGLDVLVNNAGIGAQGSVEANSYEEWWRVLDVNLLGAVRVTRAALPHLRESEHAAIVNVSSIAATAGLPNRALYSATKGALLSLTLAMAADYLSDRVRVNCVTPGTVDTPWVRRLLDAATDPNAERTMLERRQPVGRLVTAEEVAEAIVYLAGPAAGATTGTVLAVDGGMHGLRMPAHPGGR
jgi:2-keto-3-deoxy-L-fuconate dehydrogenase